MKTTKKPSIFDDAKGITKDNIEAKAFNIISKIKKLFLNAYTGTLLFAFLVIAFLGAFLFMYEYPKTSLLITGIVCFWVLKDNIYLRIKLFILTMREKAKNKKINKLKKVSVILLFPLFFIGCGNKNVVIDKTDTMIEGRYIAIYVFEGCEYIGSMHGSSSDFLTHKGNCKYCLIRNKK